jgi:hypothetical protein
MVATFNLDGFKGRVTPVVLNLIECMSGRMKEGVAV